MIRKHCQLVAAIFFAGPSFGFAQAASVAESPPRHFAIERWETAEVLPQRSVISMTLTRDGYLWLGTLSGLVRFDGIHVTLFDESNTPELGNSGIVSLFEDSQGNLWIGTETDGVVVAGHGQVTGKGFGRGSRQGRLAGICEDQTGAVWLYSADGRLARFVDGEMQGSWNVGGGTDSKPWARCVIADDSGMVWFTTPDQATGRWQVIEIDPAGIEPDGELPETQRISFGKVDLLLASKQGGFWLLSDEHVQKWRGGALERDLGTYQWNETISTASEDRDGNLIVGTLGAGLFWFDSEGRVSHVTTRDGLSQDLVLSLNMDREGNLWVGTDGGGLNRLKQSAFEVVEGSARKVVQTACQDSNGGVWIGFIDGGLAYWHGGLENTELTNASIRAVLVDENEQVWVGTKGMGLYHRQGNRFVPDTRFGVINLDVTALHQDRGGQLWLGTQVGLIRWDASQPELFDRRKGLTDDVVRAIAEDAEGNLWIGTEHGGLNRLRDGAITAFRKSESGLPSDNIQSLHVDGDGVLWIGTSGGLARYHEGRWTRYTRRDGLASNALGYLIEDGTGHLWIGSYSALMRVSKQQLNDFAADRNAALFVRAYGSADGLPTGECTRGSQPAALRSRDGTMWFPTINGLVRLRPSELKKNTAPPQVVIESVLVDDVPQSRGSLRAVIPESVTIPPGSERLEVHYTSLNLAAPDEARFQYRLEGFEDDWTRAGDVRVARYSKLPPGEYRFRVTASNEDGVRNQVGVGVGVVVLPPPPPFWQRWWFRTSSVLLLLGIVVTVVYFVVSQRLQRQLALLRQREALEKERSRIARDLHDQLGANLTQVSLLGELVESDKETPDEVESHAKQISQTARETTRALDEIVWAANPANDSLDGLVNYICKYAQEYLALAELRYRLDAPSSLPSITLPPDVRHNIFLTAKEAVNNVVKHARATEVWLRIRLETGRLFLEVEDNGRGLEGMDQEAASRRNGLRNMRKRMEDVGGSFTIGPGKEGGTLVLLVAPLPDEQ